MTAAATPLPRIKDANPKNGRIATGPSGYGFVCQLTPSSVACERLRGLPSVTGVTSAASTAVMAKCTNDAHDRRCRRHRRCRIGSGIGRIIVVAGSRRRFLLCFLFLRRRFGGRSLGR